MIVAAAPVRAPTRPGTRPSAGVPDMSMYEIDVVSGSYRKDGGRSAAANADENLGETLKFFTDYARDAEIRSVLDVGCGAGEVTNTVRSEMGRDDVLFVGVDAAKKQIQNAAKDFSAVANLAFGVARGDALPFGDRSFDIVYENSALCWSLEPAAFIGEMLRVSKGLVSFKASVRPGGGRSYMCGFGLVKMVGSAIELMFNPADYGITQFIPNFLHQTPTANIYQYPVWLQNVAWIADDEVDRLVERDDVEILFDNTRQSQSLRATRKTDADGPPTLDDSFAVETVSSRHMVLRLA